MFSDPPQVQIQMGPWGDDLGWSLNITWCYWQLSYRSFQHYIISYLCPSSSILFCFLSFLLSPWLGLLFISCCPSSNLLHLVSSSVAAPSAPNWQFFDLICLSHMTFLWRTLIPPVLLSSLLQNSFFPHDKLILSIVLPEPGLELLFVDSNI